jgi:molybdate transport system substrate-binding protein
MRRAVRLAGVTVASAAAVAACGAPAGGQSSLVAGRSAAAAEPHGSLTVFAAASLTEAFGKLGKQFEVAHAGAHITFSFGASSTLATQISHRAPADVFASASPTNMDSVVRADGASAPANLVSNTMEVAVPPDNPAGITQLADLTKPSVKVALCQPQVPCGTAAKQVFANAKITVKPVTIEADVKATLTKVMLGEVDAGIVYVTDVRAAGDKVKGIVIPAGVNASTEYRIAVLTRAKNPKLAHAFVDFVQSADGHSVLREAGFSAP